MWSHNSPVNNELNRTHVRLSHGHLNAQKRRLTARDEVEELAGCVTAGHFAGFICLSLVTPDFTKQCLFVYNVTTVVLNHVIL